MSHPATLTRSTTTGGNMFELRYEFGAEEMEAARKLAAASDTITKFHCDDGHPFYRELEAAEMEMFFAVGEFYAARLKRFLPGVADLLEWVFEAQTIEQAMATAKAAPASPQPA